MTLCKKTRSAACFAPHTTEVRAGLDSPDMRFIVSAISGCLLVSGRNCLGNELRERGQNRVPLPPAMMTVKTLLMARPYTSALVAGGET